MAGRAQVQVLNSIIVGSSDSRHWRYFVNILTMLSLFIIVYDLLKLLILDLKFLYGHSFNKTSNKKLENFDNYRYFLLEKTNIHSCLRLVKIDSLISLFAKL